jgi:hypothetical protein
LKHIKGQAVEQARGGKGQKDMQVGRQKEKRQEGWARHLEGRQAGKNTYDKQRQKNCRFVLPSLTNTQQILRIYEHVV